MSEPRYLLPAEVAEMLRCSVDRVRRMAQRGEIPHRKDGRFLKFTEKDVRDYIESTHIPAVDYRRSNPRNRKSA